MKKILLIVFIAFQFVYSQEDTLLYHYRTKALEYQQKVKVAKHKLSGSKSMVEAAKSAYFPQGNLVGRYRYYAVPLQLAPSHNSLIGEETNQIYSAKFIMYQPIYTGGNLSAVKNSAMAEVEVMKNFVGMRKQEVALNSDILYWSVVSKKETYHLLERYKDIIGEFLKVIKDRVEEEIVGKNELYQTMVRYNDAEYKMIRGKKDYDVSLMQLNRFIGARLDSPTVVADSLVVVPWVKTSEDDLDSAYVQRPEIGLYQNLIYKSEYNEDLVASKYNPELGIFLSGKWGSPSPGLQLEPGFNGFAELKFSYPILRWGQKKEEVYAMRQNTEAAKLQMEEAKDRIKLEIESSIYKLQATQKQLEFSRSSLQNAAKNVSVIFDRYKEGLSSVLEVLDAQMDWQKTYFNYILAKYEYNVSYSQYLYAVGEFNKMTNN